MPDHPIASEVITAAAKAWWEAGDRRKLPLVSRPWDAEDGEFRAEYRKSAEAVIRAADSARGIRVEYRACASDGDEPSDSGATCCTPVEAQASLKSLVDAEPPYEHGWIESRTVSAWCPVEDGNDV
jgi:hypothetical protein